ncbi:MAG TPA: hypothetical protein VJL58_03135, partial [Pyrinomonadaceae bacterium]|nr:hypothetical protein [Pyrinomonadaceae bacterium]
MPPPKRKISLVYFAIVTLLLVGLVPLVLTGWFLSQRSATELRAVENRYQIQLVQEKSRQIEMFGQRYGDLVKSVKKALELTNTTEVLAAPQTEEKLGATLRENPSLLALYVKPVEGESLALFRSNALTRPEIETIAAAAIGPMTNQELLIGQPQKLPQANEMVMTMASPVISNGATVASIVAIVSLRDIARNIVGTSATSEAELWESGLPIIFVVNQSGRAVFHPDPSLVDSQRPLVNLK